MRRWLGLTWLLCGLSACNVASVREAPNTIARNECENNDDCSGGLCVDKQCRSRSGTFPTVLFEVTPPADGSAIAGVQFLTELNDLNPDGGNASLDLGLISQVVGKVKVVGRKCSPKFLTANGTPLASDNESSVPARVSLIPTPSGALGLYSPRAVVQAGLREDSYFAFSVNLAPGAYDIYVEPNRQPDDSCPVPPQLLRGKVIDAGTLLDINLPEPSLFELHVTWPTGDGRLKGWMVDMLDSATGLTISTRAPLTLEPGGKSYVGSVLYSLVDEASAQREDQLIRLSPPDGLPESEAAPTIFLARSALGLFTAGGGTLSLLSSIPTAVHVHGQVTSGDTPKPVAATVTLVAKEILGIDPGVPASFTRTAIAGEDGQFDVHLLPGVYRVSTVPQTPLDPGDETEVALAADDAREWIVPSAPFEQAGKVIELGRALPINGQALDASGDPMATAQVQAVASPLSIQSGLLQSLMGEAPFVPRASAGGVSSTGDFLLKADPGTFDITVRPGADTGFAWLVMPNVPVTSAVGVSLGRISMPLPVAYGGTVTMRGAEGDKIVPGALIRAYVYLKGGDQYTTDRSKADSLLQVAETRADKYGNFGVLIPAELNRLPSAND